MRYRKSSSNQRTITNILLIAVACGGIGLPGCGTAPPETHAVRGTVTFAGQPVPVGEVVIEPDAERGNRGVQCRAAIEGGRFATAEGRGAVSGPVVVRIRAYDGRPRGEAFHGMPLAQPYETHLKLPASMSSHDFVIPDALRLEPEPAPGE